MRSASQKFVVQLHFVIKEIELFLILGALEKLEIFNKLRRHKRAVKQEAEILVIVVA